MKKAIEFIKFDEQGYFKGRVVSKRKYTVREAMAHLEENGFERSYPDSGRKLHYFYHLNGYRAFIS